MSRDMMLFFDGVLLSGDMARSGADLATDDTLETSVIASLFSDKRASETDELPAGETWRRGWWGDCAPDVAGDRLGSHLWLLSREKQTETTRSRAEQYAREALAWMIEDGVAKRVTVAAAWVSMGVLGLRIDIYRPDGRVESYRFEHAWQAQEDKLNAV
jgi:phage gp46-like protein